jgi:hypothetical protein
MDAILKAQIERFLLMAGLLLCVAAVVIGRFRSRNGAMSSELADLGKISSEFLSKILPLAAICGAILLPGAIWYAMHSNMIVPRTLEQVVIQEQVRRAKSISGTQVLVIGDSSAQMGVDAPLLTLLLDDKRVENLSTIGWVGPKGYARMLEMYFGRDLNAEAVVLLMHASSLDRPEGLGWERWESAVVDEHQLQWTQENLMDGIRSRFGTVLFGRLFALPMPAAWGRYYGTHLEVGDAIRENAGSIYEPTLVPPGALGDSVRASLRGRVLHYRLSPSAEGGIQEFARAAASFPVKHVLFGITPETQFLKTDTAEAEYRSLEERIGVLLRARLGDRLELLHLEPFLSDEYFSSGAHLSQSGRTLFTRKLSKILAQKIWDPSNGAR